MDSAVGTGIPLSMTLELKGAVQQDDSPIIAAALRTIVRLENIIGFRNEKTNEKLTKKYRNSSVVEANVAFIKHGIEECQELMILMPDRAAKHLKKLGEAVGKLYQNSLRIKPAPPVRCGTDAGNDLHRAELT